MEFVWHFRLFTYLVMHVTVDFAIDSFSFKTIFQLTLNF